MQVTRLLWGVFLVGVVYMALAAVGGDMVREHLHITLPLTQFLGAMAMAYLAYTRTIFPCSGKSKSAGFILLAVQPLIFVHGAFVAAFLLASVLALWIAPVSKRPVPSFKSQVFALTVALLAASVFPLLIVNQGIEGAELGTCVVGFIAAFVLAGVPLLSSGGKRAHA